MIIYYKYIIFILSIKYVISEKNYKDIKWKCANPDCSKIISEGTASLKYTSPNHSDKIRFNIGDEFEIYKKSKDLFLFYAKLKTGDNKGSKGIVSSNFIKETKTLFPDNKLIDEIKQLETQNDQKSNWNTQLEYKHESTAEQDSAVLQQEINNTNLDSQTGEASKSGNAYNPYSFLSKKNINNTQNSEPKNENEASTKKNLTDPTTQNGTNNASNQSKLEKSQRLADTPMQDKVKSTDKFPEDAVHTSPTAQEVKNTESQNSTDQSDLSEMVDTLTDNTEQKTNNYITESLKSTKDPAFSNQEAKSTQTESQNSTDQSVPSEVVDTPTNTEQKTNNVTESLKSTETASMQQDKVNQNEKSTDKSAEDAAHASSTSQEAKNTESQNSTDQSVLGVVDTPTVNTEQETNSYQIDLKSTETASMQQENMVNQEENFTDKFPGAIHTSSTSQEATESQNSTDQSVLEMDTPTVNTEQKTNNFPTDLKSTETASIQQDKVNHNEKSSDKFAEDHASSTSQEAKNTESQNSTDQSVQGVDTPTVNTEQETQEATESQNSTYQSHSASPVQQTDSNQNDTKDGFNEKLEDQKVQNSTENMELPVVQDENNSSDTKLEETNKNQEIDQTENLNQLKENKSDFNQFSQDNEINQIGVNSTDSLTSKLNDGEEIEFNTSNDVQTPENDPKTFTPNFASYSTKMPNEFEIPVHKQDDSSKYSPSFESKDVQNDENPVQDEFQKNTINTETPEIVNESDTIDDKKLENDSTMFSGVYSIMQSLQDMLSKSPLPPKQETPEFKETLELKETPELEKTRDIINEPLENIHEEIQPQYAEYQSEICTIESSWMSLKTICLLGFTSIVILIFSLGYYYMDNSKRDFELVTKNNELASELFILQKERAVLEERLQSAEEKANQNSGEASKYTFEVESLRSELNQIKSEKLQIEEKEQNLIKKCSMLETNYAKLRQMVSESKQKGERTILIADIKKLKESSTTEILKLKEQLDIKSEECKTLMVKLAKVNELKDRIEEKLNTMMSEEQVAVKHYQDSVSKLEQMIEDSKATVIKLEDEVGKLKKDNESLIIEKELAETSLQKAHGLKSSESLSAWLQSKEIQIALVKTVKNLEELELKYNQLLNEKTSLSDKEKSLQTEFEELNEKYEQAEKAKIEALTKLQVLSDYFNEKETQLQEELGTKEALWLQKQSDDHTIYEQMRTLREENQTFKNQNETLKKEIIDQETSYKKLISSAEEKADGYWVSLRQAERRLKETQIEAAQLRNRLTAIETSEISDDKKTEVNGDMPYGPPTSPPFMLYPSEFIPPPPLIPTTPSRPPPLGRISSPTLGDFTPPLPLPPFDLYPPSPPPPPPSHYVHKPQPRESRKQKDSQSSNHSSESTDKMHRRTKR